MQGQCVRPNVDVGHAGQGSPVDAKIGCVLGMGVN